MGVYQVGEALSWGEMKAVFAYVRDHGVAQIINHLQKVRNRATDPLKWGDEVEYMIVRFDHPNRRVQVTLRALEILLALNEEKNDINSKNGFIWSPEYAMHMVEGLPALPYAEILRDFAEIEKNMLERRRRLAKVLKPDEAVMTIGSFPRLGCKGFTDPRVDPRPEDPRSVSQSTFLPDQLITPFPRYRECTSNMIQRRGSKPIINIPIFQDQNTPNLIDPIESSIPNHIYMDALGFGAGCCCLQVTIQAANLEEARWLYDQLTPMTPIMMALSAATPIFRGYLADTDCRWNILVAAYDDRTPRERDPNSPNPIFKSRYEKMDSYLHPAHEGYNDVPLAFDDKIYNQFREAGLDDLLAKHLGQLFTRDPVVLYRDHIHLDDATSTEHFDNILSTNWTHVRLKPPTKPAGSTGWRLEFRPMEIQVTDFENAAYVVFVVLLTRVLISYKFDLTLSMSKINTNMERAQRRDAILTEKFYFCKDLKSNTTEQKSTDNLIQHSKAYKEMTINEIINGDKEAGFPGLVPVMLKYLDDTGVDSCTRRGILRYLSLIQNRASGKALTTAGWIRGFVRSHEDYKFDSEVSDLIAYDLLRTIHSISCGEQDCPELF